MRVGAGIMGPPGRSGQPPRTAQRVARVWYRAPVNHGDLLDAAAIDIVAKIRAREVSAREVVDAHVERLEQ
jgi:hypothetical protein